MAIDRDIRGAARLISCAEMARVDRRAVDLGTPSLHLMENAGRAVARVALDMVPAGRRVAVLCGPGNNGGDGFVAARRLMERGRQVVVGLLGDREKLSNDAAVMADCYHGPLAALSPDQIEDADLVIDAVFGAGLSRPIDTEGGLAQIFSAVIERKLPVVAVDVPSGLEGDTGQASGAVLPARRTVTFFRRKPGHVLLPGRTLCGEVEVVDIGMPEGVLDAPGILDDDRPAWANTPDLWRHLLPSLPVDGHKYHRGHAVVVSGEVEMSGAARLAARAALRIGSGLVTVASPSSAMAAHGAQLNAILLAAAQDPSGIGRLLSDKRKNAVVIGPGLGIGHRAKACVMMALASGAAAVLDADALNVTSDDSAALFQEIQAISDRPVVLTPHQGEFGRLFGDTGSAKLTRSRAAARVSGAIVVLKGADTVIAAPDGRAVINENAPPWLATAGSGDTLAGMIGGLLAQSMPAFEAACAAVWMHGAAACRLGAGLVADDLAEALPAVLQHDLRGGKAQHSEY